MRQRGGQVGIAHVAHGQATGREEHGDVDALAVHVPELLGRRFHAVAHPVAQVAVPAIVPPAFPRSAAEALAMGRPLVASAIGGLPEVVLAPPRAPDSARTGWLVAPDDAGALAHGLAAAESLDLPALRALGTRARRLATLLFAPSRVMEATLGVYTDLLQGKS